MLKRYKAKTTETTLQTSVDQFIMLENTAGESNGKLLGSLV